MPSHAHVTHLAVNGEPRAISADIRTTLLDALREHLDLTGTKKGCDQGQCGACTVLLDGERVNACLCLLASCEGASVTTIEGIAALGGADGGLHPVQSAFVKHDAFQCGFCTPGQVCSSVALQAEIAAGRPSIVTDGETVSLTREEVSERMSGNLCRCGAYPNIVDAVLESGRSAGAAA